MADIVTVGVLDASVAVKIVVPEAGTADSLAAFDRPVRWVAPRLLVVEVASALRRKVSGHALLPVDAAAALAALLDAVADGVIDLADDESFVTAALNLALAEREGAFLVSADRKLTALARRRHIEVVEIPTA